MQLKYPKLGKFSVLSIGRGEMIKPINPIAKALAHHRKRKAIVPSKKDYNREKEKKNARQFYIPEDSSKKETTE